MPPLFARWLVPLLSIAALGSLGVYAWHANRSPAGAPVQEAAQPEQVSVETVTVGVRAMDDEVSAVGTLLSNESVVLRPEVAGRIAAIQFREGAPVAKGAVMFELDAAVQFAELQEAKSVLALSESNYRRTEDMFARKFVSQSARDEAASKLEVARAVVALAAARHDKTRIRAPFSGIAGIRNISVGDYVKEGDTLVNLEDIGTLKVDFRLPELYLQRARAGQTLEVTSDALPGQTFTATVGAIDPLVDAGGRAVVMRARLDNREGRLRPGMFARVRLILQQRPAVVAVPEQALMPAAGNTQFVYRVENGVAKRVEVTTGSRRDTWVEIAAGLAPGDVIVTAGHLKLRDGAAVKMPPGAEAGGAGNKPGNNGAARSAAPG